jgi:hypothetical protein
VAAGDAARAAVAAAAGGSWPEFERGWRAFMDGAALQDLPGDRHSRPRTSASRRESRRAAKPSEEDALSNTLKGAPRFRHLRLGNMLLARERPRPAVAEYEKGAKAIATGGPARRGAILRRPGSSRLSWDGRTWRWGRPDRRSRRWRRAGAVTRPAVAHLIAGEALIAKGSPAERVAPLRAARHQPVRPARHCALADAYGKLPPSERPPFAPVSREQGFCRSLAGR